MDSGEFQLTPLQALWGYQFWKSGSGLRWLLTYSPQYEYMYYWLFSSGMYLFVLSDSDMGQIFPNWGKSETFQIMVHYILVQQKKCTEIEIWSEKLPDLPYLKSDNHV